MKVLNRPMFRYGGPIKEGVMSGIREPKKNGGLSKQFNTGLVGDERYPKTDGREHHLAFLAPAGMAALRFLPAAYRGFKAARTYKPFSQNLAFMVEQKIYYYLEVVYQHQWLQQELALVLEPVLF